MHIQLLHLSSVHNTKLRLNYGQDRSVVENVDTASSQLFNL